MRVSAPARPPSTSSPSNPEIRSSSKVPFSVSFAGVPVIRSMLVLPAPECPHNRNTIAPPADGMQPPAGGTRKKSAAPGNDRAASGGNPAAGGGSRGSGSGDDDHPDDLGYRHRRQDVAEGGVIKDEERLAADVGRAGARPFPGPARMTG